MIQILLLYLSGLNTLTFLVYALDKSRAKRKKWRIPEWQLISLALLGGSLGAWSAMYLFRHKTNHWLFKLGIPFVFVIQLVFIFYILNGK